MKIKTLLGWFVALVFGSTVGAVALIVMRGSDRLPQYGSLPVFALTDADERPVGSAELRGQVWIASFIFTRCATVCPRMMRAELDLLPQLPVRSDLWLVTFSVDPEFDTPAVLRAYAAGFGVDRQRWLFLTGDKERIWSLAVDGFRLTTAEAPEDAMPILHSSLLVLVDRAGRIRGYYDSTEPAALGRLARDTRRLLAERS